MQAAYTNQYNLCVVNYRIGNRFKEFFFFGIRRNRVCKDTNQGITLPFSHFSYGRALRAAKAGRFLDAVSQTLSCPATWICDRGLGVHASQGDNGMTKETPHARILEICTSIKQDSANLEMAAHICTLFSNETAPQQGAIYLDLLNDLYDRQIGLGKAVQQIRNQASKIITADERLVETLFKITDQGNEIFEQIGDFIDLLEGITNHLSADVRHISPYLSHRYHCFGMRLASIADEISPLLAVKHVPIKTVKA